MLVQVTSFYVKIFVFNKLLIKNRIWAYFVNNQRIIKLKQKFMQKRGIVWNNLTIKSWWNRCVTMFYIKRDIII